MGGSAHSAPSSRPIKPCWHSAQVTSSSVPRPSRGSMPLRSRTTCSKTLICIHVDYS